MLRKIVLGVLLILITAIAVLAVVNLTNASEPIPELEIAHGEEAELNTRPWWEATTVYQVYPRSFQDSDGDGVGDIAGIISRLDYIRDLGFETIWFSPFFRSPQKDFGYDVSDYYLPDPQYGDSLLVDSLIQEIHRRDMKVVFDLVLNHTSEEHPWFVESRLSKDNPKSDWYLWQDGNPDEPPTNWHSALGMNGWHYDTTRQQWYFSSFLSFQPDLNWRNPEVKKAMFKMVQHWLDKGVDGFRLDIFNYIYEDPEFTDNPFSLRVIPTQDYTKMFWQEKKYNMNHPDDFVLAKELRSILDTYDPPRFMVGEVFGDHKTLKNFLGQEQDGLNLVFLFDISALEWDADFFRDKIRRIEAFYPYPYTPTYVFSNHDRVRSITLLGDDMQKARTLSLLQLTLRGVPFYYQGEEIGMPTGNIPGDIALDPLPAAFDWLPDFAKDEVFNRDNCRTPMQWEAGPNAGFTTAGAESWLPVLPGADEINVASQRSDPNSLWQTNQKLLQIRNENAPLKWGSLRWLPNYDQGDVLAYERVYRDQTLTVMINISEEVKNLPLSDKKALIFASGEAVLEGGMLRLGPDSGVILR
ncbi:alpha-glucosidase [Robiginitalea aurantiaca]|uniref:Alpha-glucosidase n=1 Tax=Robiginitalea aurantiaca TaxID=3056915 RepID=A0ABT7WGQ6_9FLAO|nr:alpha-glucosidase [Robiginitalea aurantiaca]MDM9632102.1 alpha-glucosidase [Robiginitalea aurantiaca]